MVIPKGFSDFLASEVVENRKAFSRFHVIPVPMEKSVSYGGGATLGPLAILEASQQLEAWDGLSTPMDEGIHTSEAIECIHASTDTILKKITAAVTEVLDIGAVPVLLGGEHTITLGALRAINHHLGKARFVQSSPEASFGIVQIDAHADLRAEYEGDPFSHACVMRRAIDELQTPLFQLGVRAICHDEMNFRKRMGEKITYIDARDIYLRGLESNGIPEKILPETFPGKIYLSIDLDGLDPSVIRATGTPVPGGIGWHDTLTLLERCIDGREVIGFDVVELAPMAGDHASDFAAAQLTYSVMGMIQRKCPRV